MKREFISAALTAALCMGLSCSDDDSGPGVKLDGGKTDMTAPDRGTEAGADALLPDAASPDAGGLSVLSNALPCGKGGAIKPDPGEEGHLAAIRLTPLKYPFTVKKVRFTLVGATTKEPACDATRALRVEVWTGSQVKPDAKPTLKETLQAAKDTSASGDRKVLLTLKTPVTLIKGEHLFVAVELPGETTPTNKRACLLLCDGKGTADRNYWSGAKAAPYKWVTLSSFSITKDLGIEALGN